jgi:hypothetical protein
MIARTYHMGSCYRTTPEQANNAPSQTPSTEPNGTSRDAEIHKRTPLKRNYSRIVEPLCCELLLYQKERWKTTTSSRLLSHQ